ncbi:DUF1427 family protein [Maricaulis sp.]|uniref:DUF1427 family protein n=1 Tax=Maricaulis sp. TaxID=1486257 RepID=UPI00260BB8BD|nr:DUF1427 family protein [Maricaulis sp.]
MKIAIGLVLAFLIGVICRVADIPVPAPPALIGALLVVSMTSGFLLMDRHLARRPVRVEDKQ